MKAHIVDPTGYRSNRWSVCKLRSGRIPVYFAQLIGGIP